MTRWAERVRDEALPKVQFLKRAVEEEKERNAAAFRWIQGHRAMDMEEILTVKGQLKITKAIIKEIKKSSHFHGEEISRLEKDLSMTKICKSVMGIWFGHAEKKAYEIRFEEYRVLTI